MKCPPGFTYHHSEGQIVPEPRIFHIYVNQSTGQKWAYWVPASFKDALRATWQPPRRVKP